MLRIVNTNTIFNFTDNYQIKTRLMLEEKLVKHVNETRVLGVILRDDMSFKSNRWVNKFKLMEVKQALIVIADFCKALYL